MRILLVLALTASMALAQKPNQMLKQALKAQQSGDLAGAIADYHSLLDQHPNLVAAHTGLGAALAEQGDLEAAIAEFEIALPIASAKEKPSIQLALGLAHFKQNDFEAARRQFQAVVNLQTKRLSPEQMRATTLLASCDLKLNDPAGAIEALAPRAAQVDLDPEIGHMLGVALVRVGKFHDGAQVLDRAAEQSNDADLFVIAGSAALEDSEFELARRDLEAAHRINPRSPGVSTTLGITRFATGDLHAAEAALLDAVRTEPRDFLANLYLGVVLLARHDVPSAEPALARSATLEPITPGALADAQIVPSLSGRLDPAIASLRTIAGQTLRSTGHEGSDAHLQLAALYKRLGRNNDADAEQKLASNRP